jgi:hypothetical protein
MLGFRDYWKKKDKNYLVNTKSSNLPVEVLEPPVDGGSTKENDVPTQVSDYISSKNIR